MGTNYEEDTTKPRISYNRIRTPSSEERLTTLEGNGVMEETACESSVRLVYSIDALATMDERTSCPRTRLS